MRPIWFFVTVTFNGRGWQSLFRKQSLSFLQFFDGFLLRLQPVSTGKKGITLDNDTWGHSMLVICCFCVSYVFVHIFLVIFWTHSPDLQKKRTSHLFSFKSHSQGLSVKCSHLLLGHPKFISSQSDFHGSTCCCLPLG
jgi:hypothetical protein